MFRSNKTSFLKRKINKLTTLLANFRHSTLRKKEQQLWNQATQSISHVEHIHQQLNAKLNEHKFLINQISSYLKVLQHNKSILEQALQKNKKLKHSGRCSESFIRMYGLFQRKYNQILQAMTDEIKSLSAIIQNASMDYHFRLQQMSEKHLYHPALYSMISR